MFTDVFFLIFSQPLDSQTPSHPPPYPSTIVLLSHPAFSITKGTNCQNNCLSNSSPIPHKTLLQARFPILLKFPVFQLLLMLCGWLHINKCIFEIWQITIYTTYFYQESCESSTKACSTYVLKSLNDCLNFKSNL